MAGGSWTQCQGPDPCRAPSCAGSGGVPPAMTEPPICDLDTEARALELSHLGRRTAVEVVRAVVGGHDAVLASVLAAAEDIAALAEAAAEQLAGGGRVIYAGAGAAGRAAVADASEWTPTFNVAPDSVIALLAGVDAVAGSVEEAAAEDDAAAGAAAVRALAVSAGDLCIGVSASGRTPYT